MDGAVFILLCFGLAFLLVLTVEVDKARIKRKVKELSNNAIEITPKELMNMYGKSYRGRRKPQNVKRFDFEGVYIIYNNTKNMYYVGQSKNVIGRVKNHFSGRGNGDVYADYKYGDRFTIKMIALKNSGFSTLNSLERNAISSYKAFSRGYNKTRGNKG